MSWRKNFYTQNKKVLTDLKITLQNNTFGKKTSVPNRKNIKRIENYLWKWLLYLKEKKLKKKLLYLKEKRVKRFKNNFSKKQF